MKPWRALLMLGVFPFAISAQQTQRPAAFFGSVVSDPNERPLFDAEVLVGDSLRVRTSSTGEFVINDIPPGLYKVFVRHFGNTPIQTVLKFAPGDSVGRDFVLALEPNQLHPVTVVGKKNDKFGKLAAFNERSKNASGTYLDSTEIKKDQTRPLSDILEARAHVKVLVLNGITVITSRRAAVGGFGSTGGTRSVITRRAVNQCISQIYIDGQKVYEPNDGRPSFDINSINANAVLGIEYYDSLANTPSEFSGPAGACGTVLIWLK